jgi:hypothetical protein
LEAVDAKAANPFKGSSVFGRKSENDGGFYSTLWSSSVTLKYPKNYNIVDFEVPVTIDPSLRASSLVEWPRPAPLPLESDCILNFTTCGPLFEYRIMLAVSIHRGGFGCHPHSLKLAVKHHSIHDLKQVIFTV